MQNNNQNTSVIASRTVIKFYHQVNAENENGEEKIPTWKTMYNPIAHMVM